MLWNWSDLLKARLSHFEKCPLAGVSYIFLGLTPQFWFSILKTIFYKSSNFLHLNGAQHLNDRAYYSYFLSVSKENTLQNLRLFTIYYLPMKTFFLNIFFQKSLELLFFSYFSSEFIKI